MSEIPKVIIRVKQILIGKNSSEYYSWKDDFIIRYRGNSPWENIEIPSGKMVKQHIHSPHTTGEIKIKDLAAMQEALFETIIDDNDNVAIKSSGVKNIVNYFRTEYMRSDGNIQVVNFIEFRVDFIAVDEIRTDTEALFTIHFSADSVEYL